jgi:hypothetical protein
MYNWNKIFVITLIDKNGIYYICVSSLVVCIKYITIS